MSLFYSIKPLISICQFTGFALNQNTLKWESNPSLRVQSSFFIIYNVIVLLFIMTSPNTLRPGNNFEIIDFVGHLLLLFNSIHTIFAISEIFLKYNGQNELLNTFCDLDILLK